MEALAALLSARVAAALPFLDRAVGLARLYTKTIADGDATRTVRYPVPVFFTAQQCEDDERYLLPDPGTVGILFFEDNGSAPLVTPQQPASLGIKVANLRLLLWVNPDRLDSPLTEVALLAAVERALSVNRRYDAEPFAGILTTYTTLPAETSLFSRYTYATETPLLLPPYRLLGLDLRVQFQLSNACLTAPLPGVKDPSVC